MRNDDRRERDKRGFAPRQGGKNPPRPARRTYNIPPGRARDGPFETLPARSHDHARAETLPIRPGDRAQTRALPEAHRAERPPRTERPPRVYYEDRGPAEPPENLLAGRNPIREGAQSGAPLEKLLVAEGDLSGAARDIVHMARKRAWWCSSWSATGWIRSIPPIRGCWLSARRGAYATIEDILARARERGEEPLVVVLDQVTDPHNLGASSAAANARGRTASSSPSGAPQG